MTTHFSVVQFVPNPAIDERINIGVVVTDGEWCGCHFMSDWQRVRSFSGAEDVGYVRNIALDIEAVCSDGLDEEGLTQLASKFGWAVQLTPPRISLMPAKAMLDDAAKLFLHEPVHEERVNRNRAQARRIAREILLSYLRARIGDNAREHVKTNTTIEGENAEHEYDIAISNGHPVCLAQALSFEHHDLQHLEGDIGRIGFGVMDVRALMPDLPISILVLPPKVDLNLYAKAARTFKKLKADFIPEPEFDNWAKKQTALVAKQLAAEGSKRMPRKRNAD